MNFYLKKILFFTTIFLINNPGIAGLESLENTIARTRKEKQERLEKLSKELKAAHYQILKQLIKPEWSIEMLASINNYKNIGLGAHIQIKNPELSKAPTVFIKSDIKLSEISDLD